MIVREISFMSNPRIVHGHDPLSQQEISRACGVDNHGHFHDYEATNDEDAVEGLNAEIEEENADD
jgi:hypothetical protein